MLKINPSILKKNVSISDLDISNRQVITANFNRTQKDPNNLPITTRKEPNEIKLVIPEVKLHNENKTNYDIFKHNEEYTLTKLYKEMISDRYCDRCGNEILFNTNYKSLCNSCGKLLENNVMPDINKIKIGSKNNVN